MEKIKITESQYNRMFNSGSYQIIKENVTDEECVKRLKKSNNYKVQGISAYEAEQSKSESEVECLLEKLKSLGVDDSQYFVDKVGSKSYLLLKSQRELDNGGKKVNMYYITFWGDGDLVLTITLQGAHTNKRYVKVAYQGDWVDCDNYTGLVYRNAIDGDGESYGNEVFDVFKADGTKYGFKSDNFISQLGIGESGTLESLIKRINKS